MKNRSVPIGAAAFAIIAVLPVLLPAKVLPDFGLWLRNLSLSGGRGNLGGPFEYTSQPSLPSV